MASDTPRSHRNESSEPRRTLGDLSKLEQGDATKIDDFWDASRDARQHRWQSWSGSFSGLAQEGRDALPCDAEALRNLLHRQALGVERERFGSAYVRSTGVERR